MYLPGRKKARQKESHGLRVKAPIAAVFEDCIQAFARLADSLQVSQCNPEWYRTAHDCTLRFKLWGERSGANSRILDYVLRRSPSIKRQVVRLLEELSDALKEGMCCALKTLKCGLTW